MQPIGALPPATRQMIGVSGNLCSGKTTVTRRLAARLGWQVEPRISYQASYIADQWDGPDRWSFEAQLSFLCHKVRHIATAIDRRERFVVDRTVFEEALVFARYWHLRGFLDDRAYSTYNAAAGILVSSVPPPAIIVYCDAPPDVCAQRLRLRPRDYQSKYPSDHLATLHRLYEDWIASYRDSTIVRVDTARRDVRDPAEIELLAQEVISILNPVIDQPTLPGLDEGAPAGVSRTSLPNRRRTLSGPNFSPSSSPSVYIAASFTAHESPIGAGEQSEPMLLDVERLHGKLERTTYRRRLTELSAALTERGFAVVLPHRDVNGWGRRQLDHRTVAEACLRLVAECDIFIGILQASNGAHAEAGVALGMRKPCLFVRLTNETESFFGQGLRQLDSAVGIDVPSMPALLRLVESDRFWELIHDAGRAARGRHWAT